MFDINFRTSVNSFCIYVFVIKKGYRFYVTDKTSMIYQIRLKSAAFKIRSIYSLYIVDKLNNQ